jgi:hypothetical protein
MSAVQLSSSSALFGSQECIGVGRALGELKARRPVRINAPDETLLILPVEGLDNQRLAEFVSLCRPAMPDLIITRQRALAIGLDASAPMAVDANTTLGFDDDERDYGIAARMLQMLDCSQILLLTNNPAKLDDLTQAGIVIAARIPLETPINPHNRRYLTAKAARSGHQLFNPRTLAGERS